ncbi:DNA-binding protein [Geotalea sp. SG265]|uniref:DNA-binding protein n=1 Tax=Geotalea sp. SG265 TaxID=2922867 RepID=UPI001FAF9D97|nr:DNA-binding protein [Geotalea sp. SG265]
MRRSALIIIAVTILCSVSTGTARAGFGFGSGSTRSGLDLNGGYDVNTVTTISGTVIAAPRSTEEKQVTLQVKSGSETITVCVGPPSFWEARGITLNVNDQVTAKGSLAQGQDGKSYLMAQRLTVKASGAQVELRDERGVGLWSGRGMNGMGLNRQNRGMGFRGGMMRGGGGMMRR